jgi:ribonuclease HI
LKRPDPALDGYNPETNGVLRAIRSMKKVLLITDGSCLGNPGPGGWAAILRFSDKKKELFGYDAHTTNNRMELMAAIQGLLAIKEPCEVEIVTDSEYVRRGITLSVERWKAGHWWRGKFPVRNADLWIELEELNAKHQTCWLWTKGHAEHDDNNRCDWLAQNAARTQSSSWGEGKSRAPLRYELGPDYVPPRPQGGLFDNLETEDEEEVSLDD